MQWVTLCFYFTSLSLVRISVVLLCIRSITYPAFRRVAWGLLIYVAVLNIATFIMAVVVCTPVQKFWDLTLEGTCLPNTYQWSLAVFNVAGDVFVVVLPLPILLTLKVSRRLKMGLFFLFSVGIL